MSHYDPRQRGFTLIEMMVTLVLMSVASLLAWRALDATERTNQRLQADTDDTLVLVRALDQLKSDVLAHAGADILSPADKRASYVENITTLPAGVHWSNSALALVRNAGQGRWQQVLWVAKAGQLQRWAGPVGVISPVGPASAFDTVLHNVRRFSVQAWVPGHGWMSPDQAPPGRRATGLQVLIERDYRGHLESYRKVVVLP
jgi:general secretion pathway protein J